MSSRKDDLRKIFEAEFPALRGKFWINENCVTIRGYITTWFREPDLSAEAEAAHFVNEWKWILKNEPGSSLAKLIK
jgi:hypothetical protein